MKLLVSGALLAGYAVVALFFLKFWRRTGDRLFGFFAAAFALLALQRFGLSLLSEEVGEGGEWMYVLRLLAFVLILFAIWDKNRARPAARTG